MRCGETTQDADRHLFSLLPDGCNPGSEPLGIVGTWGSLLPDRCKPGSESLGVVVWGRVRPLSNRSLFSYVSYRSSPRWTRTLQGAALERESEGTLSFLFWCPCGVIWSVTTGTRY